jgi:hypothetical protein
MTTSALLDHVRGLGVDIALRNRLVVVRNAKTLPAWLVQTVTAHRAALKALLDGGEDRDLTPVMGHRELRRLGFSQLETGTWCHPRGDAHGERILLGLIDPQEIAAEDAAGAKELYAMTTTGKPFQP